MATSNTTTKTYLSTITLPYHSVYAIPVTQTSLPPFACDTSGFETVPETNAAGVGPLHNETFSWLESCCNGAPIVADDQGCAAYCTARNQDVNSLFTCLVSDYDTASSVTWPPGATKTPGFGVDCQGCDGLPSDPTLSTTLTLSGATKSTTLGAAASTITLATISTARTLSATPSNAAAGLGGTSKGASKTALGITSVLIVSVFAGVVML